MTLDAASVDNNDAAVGGGGLLVLKYATATATGGHLSGNSGLGGGAAAVGDGGTFNADGTTFVDNTAADSGGGAVLNSGTHVADEEHVARQPRRAHDRQHGLGRSDLERILDTANAATSLRVSDSTLSENDAWAASAILTYSPGSGATNVAADRQYDDLRQHDDDGQRRRPAAPSHVDHEQHDHRTTRRRPVPALYPGQCQCARRCGDNRGRKLRPGVRYSAI